MSEVFNQYIQLAVAQPQLEAARGKDPANTGNERRRAIIQLLSGATDEDLIAIAEYRARAPWNKDFQEELKLLKELAKQEGL